MAAGTYNAPIFNYKDAKLEKKLITLGTMLLYLWQLVSVMQF